MTERLFDTDPYLKEFEAEVSDIRALPDGQGVVLNRTAFFPEGGGQPSDSGELNGHRILEVREENGEIIHVTEKGFKTGDRVRGVLDWERRFDLMQQHTGQHILSQSFLGNLGAETAGFHLGSDTVTIDLKVPGLSDEQVMNVEKQANGIVHE
ncbi:alanyl-tRNA editing protein, partial [bacterium]|nr:alanyl-tRNA editing protein [bacterium]